MLRNKSQFEAICKKIKASLDNSITMQVWHFTTNTKNNEQLLNLFEDQPLLPNTKKMRIDVQMYLLEWKTALYIAADNNETDLAIALMNKGADPLLFCQYDLLDTDVLINPLLVAIFRNNLNLIEEMLTRVKHPNEAHYNNNDYPKDIAVAAYQYAENKMLNPDLKFPTSSSQIHPLDLARHLSEEGDDDKRVKLILDKLIGQPTKRKRSMSLFTMPTIEKTHSVVMNSSLTYTV